MCLRLFTRSLLLLLSFLLLPPRSAFKLIGFFWCTSFFLFGKELKRWTLWAGRKGLAVISQNFCSSGFVLSTPQKKLILNLTKNGENKIQKWLKSATFFAGKTQGKLISYWSNSLKSLYKKVIKTRQIETAISGISITRQIT